MGALTNCLYKRIVYLPVCWQHLQALKYIHSYKDAVKHVVAITGCSGIIYGVRLLEVLEGEKILIVTPTAERILSEEMDLRVDDLRPFVNDIYENDDLFSPVSSGSYHFDDMIIIPCSASTMAKIAAGIGDTLVARVAAVCLKEGRNLILVPRETPLNSIMIENQLKLARAGATVLPACPAFYHKPESVNDMVDFVVGKVLDQIGQDHRLYARWG